MCASSIPTERKQRAIRRPAPCTDHSRKHTVVSCAPLAFWVLLPVFLPPFFCTRTSSSSIPLLAPPREPAVSNKETYFSNLQAIEYRRSRLVDVAAVTGRDHVASR